MSKWYFCVECDNRVHISVLQQNEGRCEECTEKKQKREREREIEQEADDADNSD